MQTATARLQRRSRPPKKNGKKNFENGKMPPAVEAVLRAAPAAKETAYSSEDSKTLLSFAQDLVREGEIPDALSLSREDSDLCSELRQRNLLGRLVFAGYDKPAEKKPAALEAFSASSARTLELQGKNVTDGQMYRLICYLCFGIGTSKPLIGAAHSNKTTLQNRIQQKVNGDSERRTQFRACWRQMESAGAIMAVKSKKEKVYSLNSSAADIKDAPIRKVVRRVLDEQRKISCH